MSLEALLDHTCDIYHILQSPRERGYGLPNEVGHSYPEVPDEENIPCHFGAKEQPQITQGVPGNEITLEVKLTLPINADIRLNDKVVHRETGIVYYAQVPRNIRDHHKTVIVRRKDEL